MGRNVDDLKTATLEVLYPMVDDGFPRASKIESPPLVLLRLYGWL